MAMNEPSVERKFSFAHIVQIYSDELLEGRVCQHRICFKVPKVNGEKPV